MQDGDYIDNIMFYNLSIQIPANISQQRNLSETKFELKNANISEYSYNLFDLTKFRCKIINYYLNKLINKYLYNSLYRKCISRVFA